MQVINLAGRFLLELVAVGLVSYWGYHAATEFPARIVLAVGAPVVLIVFWGVVVAPNAANPIPLQVRFLIGAATMLLAAAALAASGQQSLGVAFGAAVIINTILLFVLGHDVPKSLTRSA